MRLDMLVSVQMEARGKDLAGGWCIMPPLMGAALSIFFISNPAAEQWKLC